MFLSFCSNIAWIYKSNGSWEISCTPHTCSTWSKLSREQTYTVHHCNHHCHCRRRCRNVSQCDCTSNQCLLSLSLPLWVKQQREFMYLSTGQKSSSASDCCLFLFFFGATWVKSIAVKYYNPKSVKKVYSITGTPQSHFNHGSSQICSNAKAL